MVGVPGVYYCGNHGLNMILEDGQESNYPLPAGLSDQVQRLVARLTGECGHHGAWVEDKGAVLTYHYRAVPEDLRQPLVARAREIILEAGMKCQEAKCALESKPKVTYLFVLLVNLARVKSSIASKD